MSRCDLFITPKMIDAEGVFKEPAWIHHNIRQIGVSPEVSSLIFNGPVMAPYASLWLYGDTQIEFRGNADLELIVHDYAATVPAEGASPPPGRLVVKGDLTTTGPILMHGMIHVTGTLISDDAIASSGTIRCNTAIRARAFITADEEIVVEHVLVGYKGIGCEKLTIYDDHGLRQPMITPPNFHRDCNRGEFCAIGRIRDGMVLSGLFRRRKLRKKRMMTELDAFLFDIGLEMWKRNTRRRKPGNIELSGNPMFEIPIVQRAISMGKAWVEDEANKDRKKAFQNASLAAVEHLETERLPVLIERPTANGYTKEEAFIRTVLFGGH